LRLAPDFVKIDPTWVRGIDEDPARQAVVGALCAFAQREGVTLIAEGVEQQGELDTLRSLGVSLVQGYLLGRPGPASLQVQRAT
jgi:EAL domain-containing protein (putative c-di-GMP-specific phosphodiesterase class I)